MRNIFIFIRRYFTFFFFLILEIFCLYMVFTYNKYHNGLFMNVANEYTGRLIVDTIMCRIIFHLSGQMIHWLKKMSDYTIN